MRAGDADYLFQGSTRNMMEVAICLFDTPENAKSAYTQWKGTEKDKEKAPTKTVGEETTLVMNPGLSSNTVHGFSRSGVVTIRVTADGMAQDTTGVEDMLTATLKRLQQVQDGKRATVTTADVAPKAEK
ncbi:hypothetical protein [Streptomyces hiroshimensis]|uniref:hypothetical protein n=1 Tax=Streptomyces hiroshimensis TaxID=66424 RepID=UPI001E31B323|nr:hypothetical protein [Streptomyces hiroshimensis]